MLLFGIRCDKMYINYGKMLAVPNSLFYLEIKNKRKKCFERELQIILKAIRQNPKSYSLIYYRKWNIQSHFIYQDTLVYRNVIEVKDLEIKQCKRLLELDARNCKVALCNFLNHPLKLSFSLLF
jgi:hypothetical protein